MKPPATKKKTRRRKKKSTPSESSSNPSNRDASPAQDEVEVGLSDFPPEVASLHSVEESGSSCGAASVSDSDEKEEIAIENCGEWNGGSPPWMRSCGRGSRKQKPMTVSAGLVSNFLRKDYVRSQTKKTSRASDQANLKGMPNVPKDDAEEFLCSVLGDDSELHMGVVRDVLCQFGYDVKKALDCLLELSASSSSKDSGSCSSSEVDKFDSGFLLDQSCDDLVKGFMRNYQVTDKQMAFYAPEKKAREILDFMDYGSRDSLSPRFDTDKADLHMRVLESLFNIPKSAECVPNSMDWKKVVTKMESLKKPWNSCPNEVTTVDQIDGHAKGDEYRVLREPAKQHWDTMKTYYQRAAAAYSRGQRDHATYLSEQGRLYSKKAREEDEKASQKIFEIRYVLGIAVFSSIFGIFIHVDSCYQAPIKYRNKSIQNTVTIDMHGQHVEQAMQLLKLYLFLCSNVPSIQYLNVVTGCGGAQGVGMGKVKQSVITLLKKEGIDWREENRGSLFIKLDGRREFNFTKSECEAE